MLGLVSLDIEAMKTAQDVRGLIRLLDHGKYDVQWRAADALGGMGEIAIDPLLKILTFPKIHVRIGVIEALGTIKSPRSVEPLINSLMKDKNHEVRWVAAVALGEIGDKRAIPSLLASLREEDRYVRYGSARALEQIGWSAETIEDLAYYHIALEDWDAVEKMGKAAAIPLTEMLKDEHPPIRARIVGILGSIGVGEVGRSCERILRDPDEDVRWAGVLSSQKCGVTAGELPLELSKRVKTGKSVIGATLLNLVFLGIGYDYLEKWWGAVILEIYLLLFLITQLLVGIKVSVVIWAPITTVFAIQTYFMAKKEAALAG